MNDPQDSQGLDAVQHSAFHNVNGKSENAGEISTSSATMRRMYIKTNDLADTIESIKTAPTCQTIHTESTARAAALRSEFPGKPNTPCEEAEGGRIGIGYVQITVVKPDGQRTTTTAHRKAWEDANGPIPKGMKVLHSCDNPPCRCLDHLWLGTQRQNIHDMMQKGRDNWQPGKTGVRYSEEIKQQILGFPGSIERAAKACGVNVKTILRWRKARGISCFLTRRRPA